MKLKLSKKDIKANRGITLIALVITIIVLLILAGVTIATLTGDNGLLTKAGSARNTNIEAEIEEEIRLAWNKVYMDSYLDSNTNKATALQAELRGKDNTATVNASGSKLSVSYRGKDKVLDVSTGTVKEPSAVAKAINAGTVFSDDNTPMTDEYGNTFIIPKGFKLSKDSAEVVTEGIVIEDATYTNTLKSEFVWIPVSKDNKKIVGPAYSGADKIAKKEATITLSRYTFDENGTSYDQEANTINNKYTELVSSSYGNAVAKTDITAENGFKEKTKAAGGFWIGRYEARVEGYTSINTNCPYDDPNWIGYTGGKLVEKPGAQVFNYITQNKASELSQKMYEKENDGTTAITKFESDLINSYAWDTATLFLQEFGWKNYSRQTSINTSGPNANGTVSDSNKDNPCNVYDMASNCYEWTTETYSDSNSPCVQRGGYSYTRYGDTTTVSYTSCRSHSGATHAIDRYSFRPVLYIK